MLTKVKEYRQYHNLTQQQLATLVGVTSRTIISLENEKYKPSLMLAYKLSKVFHTSIEDLCLLEENLIIEEENKNEGV